jgi:hypothetical protein
VGASGTFDLPPAFKQQAGGNLTLRLLAINANGKAYELDKVFQLVQ